MSIKSVARVLSQLGLAALIGSVSAAWNVTAVKAWQRGEVETFAVLPQGSTGPEGLVVGNDGTVYVATFGFNNHAAVSGLGQLYSFDSHGKLLHQVSVAGSSSHLLGLGIHPTTRALLVIDFGAGVVLKVDPRTGESSVFMTVTGSSGLNAMNFDKAGNVYVSDSFQGIIWKTGPGGGAGQIWVKSELLVPFTSKSSAESAVPPFGANGLQFTNKGDALLVANTANDQIIRIPVTDGAPGTPEIFVNSINGADGLIIDSQDNIWVAANQSDEIVVLDATGKAIAKLGDFKGLSRDGTPFGLLFPATPYFSPDGQYLYATNLALDLRLFGLSESLDSQWAAQTNRYTVSRLRIPRF